MARESQLRKRSWLRLAGMLDGVAAAMEREWFIYLFLIADIYALIAASSARRPYWFDELFTLYMSRLPSMSAVWAALKDGADLNPPLFYAVTRFFQLLFGPSEWVTRLPAMIGFLVMMLGLYRFVSHYGSRLGGMVAMTLPLVTGAFYYAHEARAYGMELGFIALGAVCWQAATRGEKRPFTLPALGLCLGGALLSHCYAVLAVAPFGFAEAARTLLRKKIDWPVWVALAIPCSAVLTYLPIMSAVTSDPFDNPVYLTTARASYEMMLAPALWPLLFALAAVALLGAEGRRPGNDKRTIPLHEMLLAGGFLAAPVLGVAIASTVTKVFMDRYGLAAILGLSIVVGTLVTLRTARHRGAAVVVIAIFVVGFAWAPARAMLPQSTSRPATGKEFRLADLDPALPIVVANGLLFLEFDHYEPKEVTDRLFFLIDRDAAEHYTGTPGFAQFRLIAKWFPIRSHLADYRGFLETHPSFYILSAYDFPMDWAMQKMRDDGVPLAFQNQFFLHHGNAILAKVSRPAPAEPEAAAKSPKGN